MKEDRKDLVFSKCSVEETEEKNYPAFLCVDCSC